MVNTNKTLQKSMRSIKKLLILYGGPSSEREVSFGTKNYFFNLYNELNPELVEWDTDFNFTCKQGDFTLDNFINYLKETRSSVLIASHGEYVEDGYIQQKFESHKIPFTGSDSKSCRVSMNKSLSQKLVKDTIKTIPTYRKYSDLKFPFIAKPNAKGSSIGVYLIRNESDLNKVSKNFNRDYIFQPYIEGRELSLGSVRNGAGFLKLRPTEIVPKNNFFDYNAKYIEGMSKEITPAKINIKLTQKVIATTNSIHNKLGLGYYSRSDFIIDMNSELYYLETNALPGMTETSILPQQLRHSGLIEVFKNGLLDNLVIDVAV